MSYLAAERYINMHKQIAANIEISSSTDIKLDTQHCYEHNLHTVKIRQGENTMGLPDYKRQGHSF